MTSSELLKEIVPGIRRAGVLWNGSNASHRLQLEHMEPAAPILNLTFDSLPVRNTVDIEKAIEAGKNIQDVQGILIIKDDQIGVWGNINLVSL